MDLDPLPVDTLPRQLARTRRFSLGHPTRAIVSPDGRAVFFQRSRAGDDPVGGALKPVREHRGWT